VEVPETSVVIFAFVAVRLVKNEVRAVSVEAKKLVEVACVNTGVSVKVYVTRPEVVVARVRF
jgi:hypothetical protein